MKQFGQFKMLLICNLVAFQTPGPGAYKVTSPDLYKRRGPGYSIIGRSKVVGDNTQKPGPGAHKPENVSSL